MVQLTGVSKTPFGTFNVGEKIRIICIEGSDEVHMGAEGIVTTGSAGEYDSPLLEGLFRIEVLGKYKKEWESQGEVLIDDTVPSTVDIHYLVENHAYTPPTPEPTPEPDPDSGTDSGLNPDSDCEICPETP